MTHDPLQSWHETMTMRTEADTEAITARFEHMRIRDTFGQVGLEARQAARLAQRHATGPAVATQTGGNTQGMTSRK